MRKSIKFRLLSLVVCILMLVTSLPVSALSSTDKVAYENLNEIKFKSYNTYVGLESYGVDTEEFIEYLSGQLWNYKTEIDIADFKIPVNDYSFELLNEILQLEMPENFNVDFKFSRFSHDYVTIHKINPVYKLSRDKYLVALAKVQATKNQILDGIKGNNKLSDVQKALLIHDRLALACEYEFSQKVNQYNLYGALGEGRAVCQGYAIAYDYLLEEIGIESYVCSSEQLNHAWNIITVDGIPYHVDVTWDDLNWDRTNTAGIMGGVSHSNFLKSTIGIRLTGHNAYDFDSYPCDTRYDSKQFWENSQTAFQLIDNEIYYFDNKTNELKRYSDKKVIKSVKDSWKGISGNYSSQLRLASDGKDLFYSTPSAIFRLDVDKNISNIVYAPKMNSGYSIYGFQYKNGNFIIDINNICAGYGSLNNFGRYQYMYNPNEVVHLYDNDCDATCNVCGQTRTPSHKYYSATCKKAATCKYCGKTKGKALAHKFTNNCDELCDNKGCSYKRIATHYFSNACDKQCNKCSYKRTTKHTYTNSCDTKCNICKAVRTIKHTYTSSCDTKCNVCGYKRTIKHKYTNSCDTTCNVCKAKRNVSHTYKTVITKATTSKNGKKSYKCSKCGYVASNTVTIRKIKTVKLTNTTYTYNGKVKKPSVIIKDSSGKTISKSYYTVTYAYGRKNVGKYKVTITFKGNYSGKRILYFTINPKAASVNSLTAKKKALNVKINRTLTGSTGYYVQYSTSKSFKTYKTVRVSNYKTNKVDIKNLKAKTTYYVRVRTYKTVSGVKYYSNWSNYKYRKTK